MESLGYSEIYSIISELSIKSLPLFSDYWNRFPSYQDTKTIIDELTLERTFWGNQWRERGNIASKEKAKRLTSAIEALNEKLEKSQ